MRPVRRRVFLAASAGAGALTAATTLSACGDEVDPLTKPEAVTLRKLIDQADADATAARRAARLVLQPEPTLTQIADQREIHRDQLTDELERFAGTTLPASLSGSASATPSTPADTGPDPTPEDVRAALRTSFADTRAFGITQSGTRAGLLASIAASINSMQEVAFA